MKKLHSFLFIFIVLMFALINTVQSQSWNALGTGTNGDVNAEIVYNGQLVAAGNFTTAGGVTVNRIASWNGTVWTAFGTGMDDSVFALAVYNNQLYAGGAFITAGGVTCNHIARWTGTAWQPAGLGTNGTVLALTVFNTLLRVGGRFTTAGGVTVNRIGRWDGTSWSVNGNATGCNNDVQALNLFNGDLIIAGRFTNAGGVAANRIVRFTTGGAYLTLASGVDNGAVLALSTVGANLYVGGTFTLIGGIGVTYIARWNGINWFNLGSGTNNEVYSLTPYGTSVAVGGKFTNAGGVGASSIATYNGTTWAALGAGLSGGNTNNVMALAFWSNVLVAGGTFTTAGVADAVAANNIAAWGSLPAAPNTVSPACTNNPPVSINPLLDWTDVPGATTYGVQVSLNPNFTSFVINVAGLPVSQYQVPTGILNNNTSYFWRANATNGLGTGPFSGICFFTTLMTGIINNHEIPKVFKLYQNYPNPFNPSTTIKFDIPEGSDKNAKLKLTLYDALGSEAAVLLDRQYETGSYEVTFDASNLASGMYFYKVEAGSFTDMKKMVFIK